MQNLISHLTTPALLHGAPIFQRYLPSREARWDHGDYTPSEPAAQALRGTGIAKLYTHQAEALAALSAGHNPLVVTPTASGKSLIYQLAILDELQRHPEACHLLLFPLKALEQDQLQRFQELLQLAGLTGRCRIAILDGDTSKAERDKLRAKPPHLLLTNPDMLHFGILPHHRGWSAFFRQLRFIVIDELHVYRGIFGSQVLQVLRRLGRVSRFYGAKPQWIAGSATIGNPLELARDLTGAEFTLIERNGAPASGRHFLLINPVESPYTVAARLLPEIIRQGYKVITFTKSRRATELLHRWIIEAHPELETRLSGYRAGFLPEERRDIEKKLLNDELSGVISTSALELGMDIGGMDVCLLLGYPGTISGLFQRAGRAGRRERDSLVMLIAGEDALDQYFMRHPEELFLRPSEAAMVDRANENILRDHLTCAAAEIPLAAKESYLDDLVRPHLEPMVRERRLIPGAGGQRWFPGEPNPHRRINLRSVGSTYSIHDLHSGRLIGDIGASRLWSECHPQAVYLHRARQYLIEEIDASAKVVRARPIELDYYTMALGEKETEILSRLRELPLSCGKVFEGELKVTERVTGYQKRRLHGGELISKHELEGPPQILFTRGFWIELEDQVQPEVEARQLHYMGSLHACEHALISLFPLEVMCDRGDVGGISMLQHPQTNSAAIFFYDAYPGGLGLTRRAYERLERLLSRALKLIQECPCDDGCPSCVHSPRCGAGNRPLDKAGAAFLLSQLLQPHEMVEMVDLTPTKPLHALQEATPAKPQPPTIISRVLPEAWKDKKVIVFDLETQRGPEEVGGWGQTHLMGVSVAVTQNLATGKFTCYREEEVEALIEELITSDLVIGFNCRRFDFNVLTGYSGQDFSRIPVLDLLEEVHKATGRRFSLEALAQVNLAAGKSGSGVEALRLYREGHWEELEAYCRRDVEITADLFFLAIARKLKVIKPNRDIQEIEVDLFNTKKVDPAVSGSI